MTTKRINPAHLTDYLLAVEIQRTVVALDRAREGVRSYRNQAQDYVGDEMEAAAWEAQTTLEALLAEQARRTRWESNLKKPIKPQFGIPAPPMRNVGPSATPTHNPWEDEYERVPITVMDRGFPRAWTPGDSVHRPRRK